MGQFSAYFTSETVNFLDVDTSRALGLHPDRVAPHTAPGTHPNSQLRITLNITVPGLACEGLHLDAADSSGAKLTEVELSLVKHR